MSGDPDTDADDGYKYHPSDFDLDEVEGIEVQEERPFFDPNEVIEKGNVDAENAAFVALGVFLTLLVVVRFVSILP